MHWYMTNKNLIKMLSSPKSPIRKEKSTQNICSSGRISILFSIRIEKSIYVYLNIVVWEKPFSTQYYI